MYFKSVVMIVIIAATAAGMLSLRQQRWEVRHDITQMHKQIEQTRRATWEGQVKIAGELHTERLEHKIALAQIDLEPITASSDPNPRRIRVVEPKQVQPPTKSKTKSTTKTKTASATKDKTKRAG